MNLHALLAVAAIGSSSGFGHSSTTDNYRQKRELEAAAQAKSLAKKQRVREEIRARRVKANQPPKQ